jgi:hypothetical protein
MAVVEIDPRRLQLFTKLSTHRAAFDKNADQARRRLGSKAEKLGMSTICPVCLRKPTSDLHVDEGQDDLGPEWLSSGVAWEWPDPAAGQRSGQVAAWAAVYRPAAGRARPSWYAYATLNQLHGLNSAFVS